MMDHDSLHTIFVLLFTTLVFLPLYVRRRGNRGQSVSWLVSAVYCVYLSSLLIALPFFPPSSIIQYIPFQT
jgi:hypothetical protein